MSFDLKITMNTKQIEKQLKDIQKNQIPFATSRAMQSTVAQAKKDAANNAAKTLDRPTKGLTETAINKGWIRAVWPSKADVKRGFAKTSGESAPAKVFIIDPLVEALHPAIFGGRQTSAPARGDAIVEPTRALLTGLSGQGRLKKLNKYGNVAGFRRGVLKDLRNDDRYLNVSLNNTDPKTKHLAPGLYFKGREIVRGGLQGKRVDKRLSRSKRKLTPAQKRKGLRVRNYLVMLLVYSRVRTLKAGKFKFRGVVVASFKKNYGQNFRREFIDAVASSKRR